MKTLILKESNWRCGDEGGNENARGRGETTLKNEQGYMCCLGQFTSQLKKGVRTLGLCEPSNTGELIPFLTKRISGYDNVVNTKLSTRAIEINDDAGTTVETKVEKLTKLFRKREIKIVFKRSRKKK